MSASVAVQDALVAALTEVGPVVYVVRPQAANGGSDAVYPHIQIGAVIFAPWDTFTETGHDFVARIHTRWRGENQLTGSAIQDAIYARLHRTTDIHMDGFSSILLTRETSFVTPNDGGFEGICEYRGLLQAD